MQAQVDTASALSIGSATAFLSIVFNLPAPEIFAAFIGTCFAIGFTDSMTYKKALLWSVGGTVATAILMPLGIALGKILIADFIAALPTVPLAALMAFCLVFFRKNILKRIGFKIDNYEVSK